MSTRSTTTYSHNGCTRCKKMKIKCDEKRPSCGACDRKKTECVYEFPFVIYDPYSKKKKNTNKDKDKDNDLKGGKIKKKAINKQLSPPFKLKLEDRRILQITLPNEFKFIAEKFSDESSSNGSPPSTSNSPNNQTVAATGRTTETRKNSVKVKQEDNFIKVKQEDNFFRVKEEDNFFNVKQEDQSQPVLQQQRQTILHQPQSQGALEYAFNQKLALDESANDQWFLPSDNNINTNPTNNINQIAQINPAIPGGLTVNSNINTLDNDLWTFLDNSDNLFNIEPQISLKDQKLPTYSLNFYLQNSSEYAVNFFRKAQPIIDAKGLTAEHSEIRDILWSLFIMNKCLSNHLYVDDDFNGNHLIDWLKTLSQSSGESHKIIFTTIIATSANAVALQTNIDYWAQIRKEYMDKTLAMLSANINNKSSFENMTCMLFTVLLLYSERSATDSNVWRLHLKGALGILKEINKTWNLSEVHAIPDKSEVLKAAINLFHFCECWFSSAESLAWISSFNGGSLACETQEDLNEARNLLFGHLQFENENPVVFDGFNTVRFYPQDLVEVMNEIVLHIMYLRVTYGIDLSELNGFSSFVPPTKESFDLGESLIKRIEHFQQYNDLLQFPTCRDRNLAKSMAYSAKCYVHGMKAYIFSNFMGYNIHAPTVQTFIPQFIHDFNKIPYRDHVAIATHWPCYFIASCVMKSATVPAPDTSEVIVISTVDPEKKLVTDQNGILTQVTSAREEMLRPLYAMISCTMFGASYSLKRIKQVWEYFDNNMVNDIESFRKFDTVCF